MKARTFCCAFALSVIAACGGGNDPAAEQPSQPTRLLASATSASPAATNLLANPGFEGAASAWTESISTYDSIITVDATRSHSGSGHAWLGGYANATDTLYQDVVISASAEQAWLQFWYLISSAETTTTGAYDTLKVELYNPTTGALLATLRAYSNLDRTGGYVQSSRIDLGAYKGQAVRLKFTVRTDGSASSSFLIDDIELAVQEAPPAPGISTTFNSAIPPIFAGRRADYNVGVNANGSVTVTDRVGGGGVQVFTNARRLVFADVAVDVDKDGTAAQVFRLYQSVFSRLPDSSGLGFHIGAIENLGATYGQVAQGFINSPEFSVTYGSLNNTQFVTQLYANVLRRAPDAAGLGFHLSYLEGTNAGKVVLTRAQVLAGFSESPENKTLTLASVQSGMEYVPMARTGSCAAGQTMQNGVCGVAALTCARPQVLQGGACVLAPPGLVISTVGSTNPADAKALIKGRDGSTIAYFGNAGSRLPSQALLTSSSGKVSRVYYGADGAMQKIVDQKTGEYLTIKLRTDALGAEYLMFNASGKFLSGYTMYRSGTDWYQAPVVGDFGQFTGNFSGGVNGSFALKSTHLVYGKPVKLDAKLALLLSGRGVASASLGTRVLDLFIPSAHAIGLTPLERGNLLSGMGLMISGGVLGGCTNPVGCALMVGGAVQTGRSLSGLFDRALDSLDASIAGIMEDRLANDLENGTEPVSSMNNGWLGTVARGFDSLKDKVVARVTRVAGNIAGLPTPQSIVDSTVGAQPLPFASSDNTPLTGTMVDAQNRIYQANGTIDADGDFTVSGTSADQLRVNIAGRVTTTSGTTGQACSQTNSFGQVLKTCTVTQGSKVAPLGVCQTKSESGGNGTFSYAYNLGPDTGRFTLTYDMRDIPDAMTVINGGGVLFSTGGLISGSRTLTVPYSGDSTVIVNLSAPNSSTAWSFTIGCGS
jgi:hypothetical protein